MLEMNIFDVPCVLFLLLLRLFSPGVIITDVHKRAGLDEDQYTQVTHHVNTEDMPVSDASK